MPPEAASNRPRRFCSAPVNAPFTWPNSSLSMRCRGIAPQLIATNGAFSRGDSAWMRRAASSLPVPLSPSSSTACCVRATRCSVWSKRCAAGLAAIVPTAGACWARRFRRAFSRSSAVVAIARRTVCSSTSRLTGLVRKSIAPLRIASTASGTVPWPVHTTTWKCGSIASSFSNACMPCMPGRLRSSRIASGDSSRAISIAGSARGFACTAKPMRLSSSVQTRRRLSSSSTSSTSGMIAFWLTAS